MIQATNAADSARQLTSKSMSKIMTTSTSRRILGSGACGILSLVFLSARFAPIVVLNPFA
jgi:hypothetical protein